MMAKKNKNNNRAKAASRAKKVASAPAKAQAKPQSNRNQVAAKAAEMSVGDRRSAASQAGVSVKDYKAGNVGNKAVARKDARVANRNPAPGPQPPNAGSNSSPPGPTANSGNTFTTAAGYQMEKGTYKQGTQDLHDRREQESKDKYGQAHNPATYGNGAHIGNFDKDGYLTSDSTKAQWQNNTALKEAGYKAGDMLWKPGSKDDLNGRRMTGRIGKISGTGNYLPEYEDNAINSSHQSTGNPGYQGEVGLGADQAAYNRQYEQDNDVTTGQVNQQAEGGQNNPGVTQGFHDEGGAGFDDSQQSPSYMPNMRLPHSSAVEAAAASQTNTWNYDQINPFKNSKTSKMNFNFNPGKFNQGQ